MLKHGAWGSGHEFAEVLSPPQPRLEQTGDKVAFVLEDSPVELGRPSAEGLDLANGSVGSSGGAGLKGVDELLLARIDTGRAVEIYEFVA